MKILTKLNKYGSQWDCCFNLLYDDFLFEKWIDVERIVILCWRTKRDFRNIVSLLDGKTTRSFDARRITVESRRAVEQLLVRRKESFDERVARRASAAAAPLAAWVRANVSYSRVLERITPLEQEQANLRR